MIFFFLERFIEESYPNLLVVHPRGWCDLQTTSFKTHQNFILDNVDAIPALSGTTQCGPMLINRNEFHLCHVHKFYRDMMQIR